jgi:hypothetical protein
MALRQAIKLPQAFLELIETSVTSNQRILDALIGFYQGRNLEGEYDLKITSAELQPKTPQAVGSKNGALK